MVSSKPPFLGQEWQRSGSQVGNSTPRAAAFSTLCLLPTLASMGGVSTELPACPPVCGLFLQELAALAAHCCQSGQPWLTLAAVATTTHRLEVAALWRDHVLRLLCPPAGEDNGQAAAAEEQAMPQVLRKQASWPIHCPAAPGRKARCTG